MPLAWIATTLLLLAPAMAQAHAETGTVTDLTLTVDGEPAHGLIATPAGAPTSIVIIAHGYTHQAESHRGHLAEAAARGAIAVAMDYRGPVDGFPLAAGAADTIAATRMLVDQYPDVPVILYSVSMGTAIAGMVLADMPDVIDWWVNNEGLSMLHETWAGASALQHPAGAAIETETGGTPATAADAYLERSAAKRASEFSGLKGVISTHGVHDGLVPYNQGREMKAALDAEGILNDFYTVLRGHAGGEGTTATGYAGFQVDGLAGHGSEGNDAHTLTALSFDLLYRVIDGDGDVLPAGRELVVDREI